MKTNLPISLIMLLCFGCKIKDPSISFFDFSQLGASVPDSRLEKVNLAPSIIIPDDRQYFTPERTDGYELWTLTPRISVIHKRPTFEKKSRVITADTLFIKGQKFTIQKIIQTDNLEPMIKEIYLFDQPESQTMILKVVDASGGALHTCFLLVFNMNKNGSVDCPNITSNVIGKSWLVGDGLFNYAESQKSLQLIVLNKEETGFQLCDINKDKLVPGTEIARFTQVGNYCFRVVALSAEWPIKQYPPSVTDTCMFNFQEIAVFSYAEMSQYK